MYATAILAGLGREKERVSVYLGLEINNGTLYSHQYIKYMN